MAVAKPAVDQVLPTVSPVLSTVTSQMGNATCVMLPVLPAKLRVPVVLLAWIYFSTILVYRVVNQVFMKLN